MFGALLELLLADVAEAVGVSYRIRVRGVD